MPFYWKNIPAFIEHFMGKNRKLSKYVAEVSTKISNLEYQLLLTLDSYKTLSLWVDLFIV